MAQDHYAALFTKLSEEGFDSREFVRRLVERGLQDLIDAGVAAHIGADPHVFDDSYFCRPRCLTKKCNRNLGPFI